LKQTRPKTEKNIDPKVDDDLHTMNVVVLLSTMMMMISWTGHPITSPSVCEALSSSPSPFSSKHVRRMQQLEKLQQQIGVPQQPIKKKPTHIFVVSTTTVHSDVSSLKRTVADLAQLVSSMSVDMKTMVQQQTVASQQQEQRDVERKDWKTSFGQLVEDQLEVTQGLGSSIADLKSMQEEQGALLKTLSKSHLEMAQVVSSVQNDVHHMKSHLQQSRRKQKQLEQRFLTLEQKVEQEGSSSLVATAIQQQPQQQHLQQPPEQQQLPQLHPGVKLFDNIVYPPVSASEQQRGTGFVAINVSSPFSSGWTKKSK
jgi:hypothetical protein